MPSPHYPLSFYPERRQVRVVEQTTWINVDRRLMEASTAQEPVWVDETPEINQSGLTRPQK